MAAKKKTKRPSPRPSAREKRGKSGGADAVQMITTALTNHEAAIRQLAEVVVNLHENIRALREVVEPLAERGSDARVVSAGERLKRVRLDE